jgi:hypothetical protein
MPDKPFVINDRRKFTADGDLRPDVVLDEPKPAPQSDAAPAASSASTHDDAKSSGPHLVASTATGSEPASAMPPGDVALDDQTAGEDAAAELPPLTAEQMDEANRAYEATTERLDTAMRASDPGGDHMPPMNFTTLVQSLYMQAILQLGGGTQPGQQPRVDLLGARQTTDMLATVAEKSHGNLTPEEQKLIDSALFEMRMGFLDVTQALARQAAARQASPDMKFDPTSGPQPIR